MSKESNGVYNRHVKRGETVVLLRNKHDVWIRRTAEDVKAIHDANAAAGRWCDDGGEPIMVGPWKGWPDGVPQLTLVVTSCRGQWAGWHRKPKGLRTGFCAKLNCQVLFRSI